MKNESAICYVTDANFLLPTIISAASLRKFVSADKADVYVFVVDEPDARIQELMQFMKPLSIQFIGMNSSSISGFNEKQWSKGHVTKTSLGRFFISEALPSRHKKILYIDGDTLIMDDPLPLVNYPIPEGRFAAVEDWASFCSNDWTGFGQSIRNHLKNIGIDRKSGYFNAGVFLVTKSTWSNLAREAFDYFRMNVGLCRYHDQSALNAVVQDRRLRLSPAWNFQTAFRHWNVEKIIRPKIYHFTQAVKPWMGIVDPWKELFPFYEKEIKRLSQLNLSRKVLSVEQVHHVNLQARYQKQKLLCLFPFRLYSKRREIKKMAVQAIEL